MISEDGYVNLASIAGISTERDTSTCKFTFLDMLLPLHYNFRAVITEWVGLPQITMDIDEGSRRTIRAGVATIEILIKTADGPLVLRA
jgi:hypothetical protein